jgi:hypothetical protein
MRAGCFDFVVFPENAARLQARHHRFDEQVELMGDGFEDVEPVRGALGLPSVRGEIRAGAGVAVTDW